MKGLGIYQLAVLLSAASLIQACAGGGGGEERSNTAGEVTISVDETLSPVIEEELKVFHADYPEATITPLYVSEQEAIRALMLDSSKVAIATRALTPEEEAQFKKTYQYTPRSIKIAVDAVALILNKANHDTLLTAEEVRSIFRGEVTRWDEMDDGNIADEIKIVFDNPYSSTISAVKKFADMERLDSSRMVAAQRNTDVISYVEENPNALGIIGVNWISHPQDSAAQAFLGSINLVGIAPDQGKPGHGQYYKPYQAYLAQGYYPISREVFAINAGMNVGLGTGFVSFLASERGQLIIFRGGLLPARQPVRLINIQE
ncbi:phosphate ABC transporter substrate-binding protein (PhoT family) [Anseongella ginsenosidimutans]|uniref:Phosphate ABC transporter substrate-binding protein (PhoT family) n=1 Tax=Anseongella ginsenosidimutans TaxID=496056 RepID=A0A4V2UU43_9SPHI|nr:substrate-binding domain-containing protein [Anseongella ginsenosidimutans]QEC51686.1 phosphate ABC transporter substrate-binding protein [Anseongella ginsenosidimutans]TCS89043.1 phosphate ABC transporter substrate-binding protein (PhoT family) [Anseongella ginsenosidimutans]